MSPADPPVTPVRVAVLGGGIAGLTAAFELTRPVHRGAYEVTVYTQGWRLGGKGASGRWGPHDRIHEHGLHVWFGFYRNALGLMEECLGEQALHRPGMPAGSLRDAFSPVDELALVDGGRAYRLPLPDAEVGDPFFAHLPRAIVLWLRRVAATLDLPGAAHGPWGLAALARAELQAVLGVARAGHYDGVAEHLGGASAPVAEHEDADGAARFLGRIAKFWGVVLRGLAADVLPHAPDTWGRQLDALNRRELRTWLQDHGADDDVLQAPFVRALYDLVFAYRGGDPARPEIAAGTGVENLISIFGRSRASCMLKLRGGMGDVVFTPLYEVLEAAAASDDLIAATDIADLLVKRGVPFRECHGIVAGLVRTAVESGRQLSELTPDELRAQSEHLDEGVAEVLTQSSWLESKVSEGGTALPRVREQLAQARALLA